ncbi:RNA polymerase recycling motor HelD [Pseudalkalibacillus caeni]|uniref:DNA 3'-5' helicase n=1 Tax=Exobacillus caeni TaxID=2574798 RepID=A0A5R9F0V6_9BACL|nr:RNA polymerase recycling motor HelD [Pseudalkalibacillus caeni]TLS36050.1 helicase [Pseudalkalibacillus caeni]
MAENPLEWQNEQNRVEEVLRIIKNKIKKYEKQAGGIKGDIVELRKNFWDDVTVNVDNAKERVETEAALRQQSELLSERERSHGQLDEQLKKLTRMKDSPYFGRFDFQEEGEKEAEKIYIGIASLMDENEEDFLVYDWRAPISSMYYDYSPGPAQYEVMDGTISGEMEVKRQFIIRNGTIKGMFDTGITIGDELLQEVLSNAASTKMNSIVATIQKEQNQIIRHEKSKTLIVQGVAGSGKTSAALQRVAYLLYRYRQIMSADNILLFSPNPLFNSYVATVLPQLGEENMMQTTLQQYIESQLEQRMELEGPAEQMEYILTERGQQGYEARRSGIKFKAGLEYKALLDHYFDSLSNSGIVFNELTFRGETLISTEEMEDYFYSLDDSYPISNRIDQLKDWLLEMLNKAAKQERKKDWVAMESELLDKEDYLNAYKKLQEKQSFNEDTFDDFEREEKFLARLIVNRHFKPLRRFVKTLRFLDVKETYANLFKNRHVAEEANKLFPEDWGSICDQSLKALDQNILYWEDAIPYLYLKDQLSGRTPNLNIRHVLIDEAQDYSPFQFEYLKNLFPYSGVTLLGDFNQAIYAHTFGTKTLLAKESSEEESVEKISLKRSYRSTREIVEFTKGLIENGEEIEAFNREGTKPVLIETNDRASLNTAIVSRIKDFQSKGYESVAVICKTMKETKAAFQDLHNEIPIKMITEETYTFEKGVTVIPAYLAKGIEFDAVVLYDASQYSRESERKLFYTACTRAMHELAILSIGDPGLFMNEAQSDTYIALEEN